MPSVALPKRPARLVAVLGAAALTLLAAVPSPAGAVTTCDRVVAATGSDSCRRHDRRAVRHDPQARAGAAARPDRLRPRHASRATCSIRRDDVTVTSEPGQRGKVVGQRQGLRRRRPRHGPRPRPRRPQHDIGIVAGDPRRRRHVLRQRRHQRRRRDLHDPRRAGPRRRRRRRAHAPRRQPRPRLRHLEQPPARHLRRARDRHAASSATRSSTTPTAASSSTPTRARRSSAATSSTATAQGIIFGGTGGAASSDNVVRGNVLTNPRLRASVESWWDSDTSPGTGNLVEDNCVFGGRQTIDRSGGGFDARDNAVVDPEFVDRANKDFRLREGSPCAALLAAGRAEADVIPPVEVPEHAGHPRAARDRRRDPHARRSRRPSRSPPPPSARPARATRPRAAAPAPSPSRTSPSAPTPRRSRRPPAAPPRSAA